MYQLKIDGQIYQLTNPHWIKEITRFSKTMIVNSAENDAIGVKFNDIIYHIEGKPEFKSIEAETIELIEGDYMPPSSISEARAAKLAELRDACEVAIYAGVSVKTTQGIEHFALTLEDQTNISNVMLQAQSGSPVLYHADGELCRWFEPQEFMKVAEAVIMHKTYHTTLCNHLNSWVRRTDDIDEVAKISYTSPLPKDLADHMNELLNGTDDGI